MLKWREIFVVSVSERNGENEESSLFTIGFSVDKDKGRRKEIDIN